MQEADFELLRTLAGMDGYTVEEREDGIVLTADGGLLVWYVRNDADSISEAINHLTQSQLHPLDE